MVTLSEFIASPAAGRRLRFPNPSPRFAVRSLNARTDSALLSRLNTLNLNPGSGAPQQGWPQQRLNSKAGANRLNSRGGLVLKRRGQPTIRSGVRCGCGIGLVLLAFRPV